MKRFFLLRWICILAAVLIGAREVSYPIDSRMVLPNIGEMFQSQSVVVHAQEIPDVEYLSDFSGLEHWIDDVPAEPSSLQNNVVLVQFWSYTCIPCVDAIPYMKEWWSTYKRYGLQVVGIHSPSFQSETRLDRVTEAVKDYGITYPVGFDSEFEIWRSFSNRVWPALYLFDRDGTLAYQHIGIGGYEEIEVEIQRLLGVTEQEVEEALTPVESDPAHISFGYKKQYTFASPEKMLKDQSVRYSFPSSLDNYQWALDGEWILHEDHAESVSPNAKLRLYLTKPELLMAFGTVNEKQSTAVIRLDGQYVDAQRAGEDLLLESNTTGESLVVIEFVQHFKILQNMTGPHLIEIEFPMPGSEAWSANYPTDDAE